MKLPGVEYIIKLLTTDCTERLIACSHSGLCCLFPKGEGVLLAILGGGVRAQLFKPRHYFRPKYGIFWYLFSDMASKIHTHFQARGPFLESPSNLSGPISIFSNVFSPITQ